MRSAILRTGVAVGAALYAGANLLSLNEALDETVEFERRLEASFWLGSLALAGVAVSVIAYAVQNRETVIPESPVVE